MGRWEIHNRYTDKRKTAVSKVKDADDKIVGPAFKTMKSELVAWPEAIRAKKYDLHDEKQHDQPEGAFTERNVNRSQQSRVRKRSCKMSWMKEDRFFLTT